MSKMIVNLPIEVPRGPWCWNHSEGAVCTYFDNEGGHPTCDLRLGILRDSRDGNVRKPDECARLKENEA